MRLAMFAALVAVLAPSGFAQAPLPHGEPASGTLSSATQQDLYSFTASAGDSISVRLKRTSGRWAPRLQLRTIAGVLLKEDARSYASEDWAGISAVLTEAGTFTIAITSNTPAAFGGYTVCWQKWNNPPNTTPLPHAQLMPGKRTQLLQLDLYTLTVNAGDFITLRLKRTAGNFKPYLGVRTLAGAVLKDDQRGYSSEDWAGFEYKFEQGGTYIVAVDSNGWGDTGEYGLFWQKWNNPANTTPLPHAQLTSGKRAQLLQLDLYTLTVNAGDFITLRLKRTAGNFRPYLGVRTLAGAVLKDDQRGYSSEDWAGFEYKFEQGGTYIVAVDSNGWGDTGDYGLFWQKWNNPANTTPLPHAQLTSGKRAQLLQLDLYTLTVNAGDFITLRLKRTAGNFKPYLGVRTLAGAVLKDDQRGYSSEDWAGFEYRFEQGGTYIVAVDSNGWGDTGDYGVFWQKWNNPANTTPLPHAQLTSGKRAQLLQLDLYTLTVNAGDFITLRLKRTAGNFRPYLGVRTLAGAVLKEDQRGYSSEDWAGFEYKFEQGGTYVVAVDSNGWRDTGDYGLYWQKWNNPANTAPLPHAQLTSGKRAQLLQLDLYTLTVNAGDFITLRLKRTAGNFKPYLGVRTLAGAVLKDDQRGYSSEDWAGFEYKFEQGGTYIVAVDSNGWGDTGDYGLFWQKWNNPANTTPLPHAQLTSGKRAQLLQLDLYTLTVNAGDFITLRLKRTAGSFKPYLGVRTLAGAVLKDDQRGYSSEDWAGFEYKFEQGGTYIVAVDSNGWGDTGDYGLCWQKWNNPPNAVEISPGTPFATSIARILAAKVAAVRATAGDRLLLQLRSVGGRMPLSFVARTETGDKLAETSGTDSGWLTLVITARQTGATNLFMHASDWAARGPVTFVWQNLSAPARAGLADCGSPTAGRLSAAGDVKFYTFRAKPGDIMRVRNVLPQSGWSPWVQIFAPSGKAVGASVLSGTNWWPAPKLEEDGQYLAEVSADGALATGGFSLLREATNRPCDPPEAALAVSDVYPGRGGNAGPVTVTLSGRGLNGNLNFKLTRPGNADLRGTLRTAAADGATAEVLFDLSGQEMGTWDVVATDQEAKTSVLPQAFLVERPTPPRIRVRVAGPPAVRPNRPATVVVDYTNESNADLIAVVLTIRLPREVKWTPGFKINKIEDLPTGPDDVTIESGSYKYIPLVIPRLTAKGSGSLVLEVIADRAMAVKVEASAQTLSSAQEFRIAGGAQACAAERAASFIREAAVSPGRVFRCQLAFAGHVINLLGGSCAENVLEVIAESAAQREMAIFRDLGDQIDGVYSEPEARAKALRDVLLDIADCIAAFLVPELKIFFTMVKASLSLGELANDCFFGPLEDALNDSFSFQVVTSIDPNDKTGLAGAGIRRYIGPASSLVYSIAFENLPAATAPAQTVEIRDSLDANTLDLDSVVFGDIKIGSRFVGVPPGARTIATEFDLRPGRNLLVKIEASLANTEAVWRFTSLDPATGKPPANPLEGFLPPNRQSPEGEGNVLLIVNPRRGLTLDEAVRNEAAITFDTNAAIKTPLWTNTVDDAAPASSIVTLSPSQSSVVFDVQWQGNDRGAGVRDYTVYSSEDGSPFTVWLRDVATTTAPFFGRPGRVYSFYSIARDRAGNVEPDKIAPEASTRVNASAVAVTALNGWNYRSSTTGIAPGALLSIFGSGAAPGTSVSTVATWTHQGADLTLPGALSGFEVRIGGKPAPLLFAGAGKAISLADGVFQINCQIPQDLPNGPMAIEVVQNGSPVGQGGITTVPASPGFFTLSQTGTGQVAALNQDGTVNGDASTTALPGVLLRAAPRGSTIALFGSGAGGSLKNFVTGDAAVLPSGQAAACDGAPLLATMNEPVVLVGGVRAKVVFSGMAPCYAGLWQLNIVIPASVTPGAAVPVSASLGGAASNAVTIAVR